MELYNIPRDVLELHRFCGDESCYNLQVICVELEHAIATDGHMMAVRDFVTPICDNVVHIPAPIAKQALKAAGRRVSLFTARVEGKLIKVLWPGGEVSGEFLDVTFPSWEQVLPGGSHKATTFAFNPELIARVHVYLKACGHTDKGVRLDAPADALAPFLLTLDQPDFQARFVIMPMRL